MKYDLIATRHLGLVEYFREDLGIEAPVLEHATLEDVRGKHVLGVLPFHLAATTASYTTATFEVPRELRGQELTKDQVKSLGPALKRYEVRSVSDTPAATSVQSREFVFWLRHYFDSLPGPEYFGEHEARKIIDVLGRVEDTERTPEDRAAETWRLHAPRILKNLRRAMTTATVLEIVLDVPYADLVPALQHGAELGVLCREHVVEPEGSCDMWSVAEQPQPTRRGQG